MAKGRDVRVAVVTGASAGVGRATVRLLAQRGIAVALLARGRVGLDAAAEEVRSAGGRPLPIEVDVADYEQVVDAGRRIEAELGPIDLWINDAFSSVFAPFQETRPEEFRRATEVTYLGYVHGTRVALSHMTPATGAPSCRWDRRWRTGVSRCRRPTAGRSTRSWDSPSRCAANCCTNAAGCG